MASPGSSGETRQLTMTLVVYTVVFAAKLAAYAATGVLALLAESLHTLSDIVISAFLLGSLAVSRKAPDAEHAYGHGRAQNVASLVAATIFLSFTSLELFREAVPRLWAKAPVEYTNLPLAMGVIVLSMLAAAAPLAALMRNPNRGAAARAQLAELVNDELGLLAALAGIGFVMAGWPLADPLATMAVAAIIAYNAVKLLRENAMFLLGQSPGPEYLETVRATALGVPGVLGIHGLRAEYIGPEQAHASIHLVVARGTPIEEADRIAVEAEARIRAATGCRWCVIHVDPAPEERTARDGSADSRRLTQMKGRPD